MKRCIALLCMSVLLYPVWVASVGKEVILGAKLVRSTPPDILKQYIARIKQQGLTVRGQTPEVDALVQDIVRSLSAADVRRIEQLEEQSKKPSGGSRSGSSSGTALGGGSRGFETGGSAGKTQTGSSTGTGGTGPSGAVGVSETGGNSAGTGTVSGGSEIGTIGAANENAPAQQDKKSDSGSAPTPPPPPPPLPVGGGTGKQTKDDKAKEDASKKEQNVVLREDEVLAADSPLAAISDLKVLAALETLAQESFTGHDTKIRATSLPQPAPFTDAFQAYLFFMDDVLAGLESDTAFKKPASLRQIMGEDGAVRELIKHNITKGSQTTDAFLTPLYAQLSSQNSRLVDEFSRFIKMLFFNSRESRVADLVRTIINNIAVSQRVHKAASASRLDKIESDEAVIQIFMQLFDQYRRKEGDDPNFELSQDYIEALYREIDLLRLNPAFLRFMNLQGSAARAAWEKESNPLQKISKVPVLYLLGYVTDPKAFRTVESFMAPVRSQLLFDNQGLHAFERDDNRSILTSMLADHERRLANQLGKKSPEEIFEAQVFGKKTVTLRDVLAAIKQVEKLPKLSEEQKRTIRELEAQLTSTQPDVQKITTLLQSIVTVDDQQIARINSLVEDLGKRNALRDALKRALAKAQLAYRNTKQPVGAVLYQALRDDRAQIPFGRIEAGFTLPTREPDDIWSLFSSVVGSASDFEALMKEAGIENKTAFLALFEPYGTLVKLMQTIQEQTKQFDADKKEGPARKWALLMNSLAAMNNATGDTGSKDYAQIIKDNRGILVRGTYRNMLTPLISALEQGRIEDAQKEIVAFVSKAQVGVEAKDDFKKALKNFMQFVIATLLAQQIISLDELNRATGDVVIPGISLEGAQRSTHAQLYRELKGAFKPLLDILMVQGKFIDAQAFAKIDNSAFDKAFTAAKQAVDGIILNAATLSRTTPEAKQLIAQSIQQYLDAIQQSILNLKKAVVAQDAVLPNQSVQQQTGGVPPPPPPPPPVKKR